MADPHWTAYVGMASGIIGVISGISGAVMGYISYQRSKSVKAFELRLELRKAVADALAKLSELGGLLEHANQSRQRVAAATGKAKSGAMEIWDKEFAEDKGELQKLLAEAPFASESYDALGTDELESKLVAIHELQHDVDRLTDKYKASLARDDEERKQIREDVREWTRNAR